MKRISREDWLAVYAMMLKIRLFEEKIVELYPQKEMRTPVHLCLGQEAIAAGVCFYLKKEDFLFSTHRCHGHCLAKGMDMRAMMAEFYGKRTGCCVGKGGSMHLSDPNFGVLATSAIVGGGIPLAVGAAWAAQLRRSSQIAVVFFGDGATEEGVFSESLNFAALKKLPILFICENNFYATNSPLGARQPLDNIHKKGEAFGIKGFRCDGNDVRRVLGVTEPLVENIRRGSGPYLLECRTYRWKGHVGPDCDVEKGCRPRVEHEAWLKKCPLKKIERDLLSRGVLSRSIKEEMTDQLSAQVDEAVRFAQESLFPDPGDVLSGVYGCP